MITPASPHLNGTENGAQSSGFQNLIQQSIWVERKQSGLHPACLDVARSERLIPRGAVERHEMLLVNRVRTASVQLFNLVTIRCLQWTKDPNVTGLKLMRGMGRDTAQGNVVFEAILQDLKSLMCPKAA